MQNNSNLLTTDELTELTGAKLPSRQAEILSNNRIGFITRADNKLRTTWDAVNSALTGSKSQHSTASTAPKGFHLDRVS
jgi:hypothetical protein